MCAIVGTYSRRIKVLAVALLLSVLFLGVMITPTHAHGDVNEDGDVNVLDTLLLLVIRILGGTIATYPEADVNGDGDINVLDQLVLNILRAQGHSHP